MVHRSRFMVHGSWFMVHGYVGSSFMVHGYVHRSSFKVHRSSFIVPSCNHSQTPQNDKNTFAHPALFFVPIDPLRMRLRRTAIRQPFTADCSNTVRVVDDHDSNQ